jgi:hypothetical protein
MPGLQLTAEQVQRLCGIDPKTCRAVLDVLVRDDFLCVKPDGTYSRPSERKIPQPRAVRADSKLPRRWVG